MSWLKNLGKLYTTFAVITLNVVIFLVILNVILAIIFGVQAQRRADALGVTEFVITPYEKYGYEQLAPVYPGWDAQTLQDMLHEVWMRKSQPDPHLYQREAPFDGEYVHVDAAGFRHNAQRPPWPPEDDTINIFVFGGSTTFGYGLPDEDTIPAHMQDLLAEVATAQPVQVYNFGQGAWYSALEMRLFQEMLLDGYRPDLVIFFDGLNEIVRFLDIADVAVGEAIASPGGAGQLISQLPMFRLVSSLIRRPAPDVSERNLFESDDEIAEQTMFVDEWITHRRMIRGIASEFDIPVVFVWQPIPYYNYDDAYYEQHFADTSAQAPGYEYMASLAETWQMWDDFLYLADVQSNRQETLYVDNVHYTASFSRDIAREIVEFLTEADFVQ